MSDLQKGVIDYMKTGDNVALVNVMKSDMYAKLAEHPVYSDLVSELDKYATAYDANPRMHKAADEQGKE